MTTNEFIKNGKSFLFEDDYSKCRSFFYSHKEYLNSEHIASEAAQILLKYLKTEGHLRSVNDKERERIITSIIAFASKHSAPFDWEVDDPDYVDKIYDLYCELQRICNLDQNNQLLVITRIMSVIYGCCPAFTPQLLAVLNLPLRTENALQCFISYQQFSIAPLFLAALLALMNPNTKDNIKEWATETIHAIYDDSEKQRRHKYYIYQSLKV